MTTAPIPCMWTGDAFVPLDRALRAAREEYGEGEVVPLIRHEDRSAVSHNHEFAWLHDAWLNLPENVAESYPTAEHLRKRALIQAGYFTEQVIDCSTSAAALRVAAYARGEDEFAYVIVRGTFVVVRKAKSQSRRAMPGGEFQASKTAIMEIVSEMIGVPTYATEGVR